METLCIAIWTLSKFDGLCFLRYSGCKFLPVHMLSEPKCTLLTLSREWSKYMVHALPFHVADGPSMYISSEIGTAYRGPASLQNFFLGAATVGAGGHTYQM